LCRGKGEPLCGMDGEVCCGQNPGLPDFGPECMEGLECDYSEENEILAAASVAHDLTSVSSRSSLTCRPCGAEGQIKCQGNLLL
jgi:hypothetical protein